MIYTKKFTQLRWKDMPDTWPQRTPKSLPKYAKKFTLLCWTGEGGGGENNGDYDW